MKICYFDAFSGISGDMTVGALVDAGADWNRLEETLHTLNLGAESRLEKTKRHGIAASKFHVDFKPEKKHRHLLHIEKIIEAGALSPKAKSNALAVFRRLGEAEARSHAVPIERVHFHEVGAVDSICDIVGACVALDLLGIEEIYSSRINVGSGTVHTEHGTLPVPAPATTDLLKDRPIYSSGPEAELTTPTGAALLTTLAKDFGKLPPIRVLSQGFGAGDKDFPTQANVLRVLIGERTSATESTSVTVLEANIDDSTPQILAYAMERLLDAGALDVTLTPTVMKKNRPATVISAIAAPDLTEELAQILFAETSTLGIRVFEAQRRVLPRQVEEVETRHGKIRIKYTDTGTFTPEYEDCRRAAQEHGVPLRVVMSEASQAFRHRRQL
ncbi:MAG: nickel pincer cofactor biosynthesis protein LarC [Acidobacteriaceae bacterium]|nr:nickel pincer cofactor biosynthesis protein LarC [Acidobacteriaceae bacterium]MBV9036922.1 nickel pincer cofactor biosynthesis protein LarC [Acidobacteriaceae bacterium]MBV9677569.1 nickel pincer cofactor biosynthesis protein LarC [Acidobacteriaceae bacterium]